MLPSRLVICLVVGAAAVYSTKLAVALEWQVEVIAADISAEARNSSLALDPTGRPHVLFYDENDAGDSELHHAVRTASGWELQKVDDTAKGDQTVIRFDADGTLHILYNDIRGRERVRYGVLRDDAWQLEDVHSVDIRGRGPEMVLDNNGRMHIAFVDNGGIDFATYYGVHEDGAWTLEKIGSGSLTGSFGLGSIALEPGDRPVLIGSRSGFHIARLEDGVWTIHTDLGPSLYPPNMASTKGEDGRLHVSGITSSDESLVYIVGDGLQWSATIIEPTGPIGSANTSIAPGLDGNPRISYESDLDGSGRTTVRYASFDGAVWTTERVGDDVTAQSGTSLAIDGVGAPHVVYWRSGDGGQLIHAFGAGDQPPRPSSSDCNGNGIPDSLDLIQLDLEPPARVPIPFVARSLVVSDLDADGDEDVVVTNDRNVPEEGVAVLLGDGSGGFGEPQVFPAGLRPFSVIVADFNADRKPDLATANFNSLDVSVLLGRGDGTFESPMNFAAGEQPRAIVAADFNGDQKIDVAAADGVSDDISVFLGFGDGTLGDRQRIILDVALVALIAIDINLDEEIDLVAVSPVALFVLLGNGDGTFADAVEIDQDIAVWDVAAGDFNGDGIVDLVTPHSEFLESSFISVMWGNGDGTFEEPIRLTVTVDNRPEAIDAADLNADGHLDIVTNDSRSDTVMVFMGLCGGAFSSELRFDSADEVDDIASGDFDGDGKLDVVALGTRLSDPQLAIHRNLTEPSFSFDRNRNCIPDECESGRQIPGDITQDALLDISDACSILTAIFLGDPQLPCGDGSHDHPGNVTLLDWQADGMIDLSDAVSITRHLFLGSPPHALSSLVEVDGCVPFVECPESPGCGAS